MDEAIHLINAFQLGGFHHVVGTLWEIDDEYSVDAAREVYMAVKHAGWSGEAVALGVHNAARLLRQITATGVSERTIIEQSRRRGYAIRQEGIPSIWAAYIHVGS
jgi:hypothetical protein